MKRDEAIERMCKLLAKVGETFDHHFTTDCICGDNAQAVVEWEVIEWVENAIDDAIEARKKSLTCPHCGYVRKVDDYKSWCEEHNVCVCPECGLCPEADGVVLTNREREEERIIAAVRNALRKEYENA